MNTIERVARAICEKQNWPMPTQCDLGDGRCSRGAGCPDSRLRLARAAIEAMREPSEAMADRGEFANSEWLNDAAPLGQGRYRKPAKAVWRSMIDVALGLPEQHGREMTPDELAAALEEQT